MAAVTAAQDDRSDDIALTENGTDDLGIIVPRIIPGDFNVRSGWRIKKYMFALIHDCFERTGHRRANEIAFYAACCGDDLIAVGNADTVAGGRGERFCVLLRK